MNDELWTIVDSRTEKPVTIAAFLSETGAKLQIKAWVERDKRGVRPDCHDLIPYLEPRKILTPNSGAH